jgi:WD40 repeat protein/type II secretory pathway predicted ATPase ExeA
MAQVYRAFHPTLERDVAIKVIHPRLADDADFVERFRHEAKVIAALRHPGIVQVYDFEIEGDTFYMVMEFVPGESLQEHLAALYECGEQMSLDKALLIFRPIVQAVAYAHGQGVVHRDLKPANVLFTSEGEPVLADFGLSRILGTERLASSGAIVGTPTYMSPEQGEGKIGDERSDIYSLGVMLYELTTGIPPFSADSPVSVILKHLDEPLPPPRSLNADLPASIEQVIQQALAKEPDARFQSALEVLNALDAVFLPGALPEVAAPPPDERCPYRGLQVFEEEHADFFYGREALVGQLLNRLEPIGVNPESAAARSAQFLAVVGASGSGKSSLVRAGLVPTLRRERVPGSSEWLIQIIKPGSQPLEALAACIAPLTKTPTARLRDDLAAQGRALHQAVRRALADKLPEQRLVLLVDQFEEVFTLCQDEMERARFVENLLYASAIHDGRIVVILTMRADFYHRCAAYRDLASRISARQVLVGPMNEAELRRAIEQPARRVGLRFEPGLVDTILADVARQPGSLPLLQHALLELWEQRQGRLLTLSAYQASGGVSGAITRRADGVYDSLGSEEQAVVRRLMLRLTQPGEGTEDTRRRAKKRELLPGSGEQQAMVEGVLQRLVHARLLTTSRDTASGEEVVDVAHEALIRGWVRLQGWIDEDRMALHTHRQLTEAAETWEQNDRDASYLYRGVRLAQAGEWVEMHAGDLNKLEQAFLGASQAAAETREREREAQRQHELAQAQALAESEHRRAEVQARASRRLRWLAMGLALVFLLAIGAAIWALGQQQRAQAAAELSHSLNLSTSAQLALSEHDTDLALALAVEANRIPDPPPQARLTLADVAYAPGTRRLFAGHSGSVEGVAINPDGRTALSASADGTLILWDLETGESVRRFTEHEDVIHDVALHPDGRTALSASADGTLILWDLETGESVRRLKGHSDAVWSVAIHPDGRRALSGSADNTLILWDLETGDDDRRAIRTLKGHEGTVYCLAIGPDGRTALSGSADRSVILWDLESGEIQHMMTGVADTVEGSQKAIGHFDSVWGVAYRPHSRTALSVSVDEFVILWDLETGQLVQRFDTEVGLYGMAMSADGRTALLGALDNRVLLLDLDTGQISLQLRGHTGRVLAVASTPGDRMALSGSADGTLRLWDLYSGAEMRRLEYARPPDPAAAAVAVSSDGQLGMTGLWTGEISLWDYATGQEIRRLRGHTEMVFGGVHFLPGGLEDTFGRRAVSGSGDIYAVADDSTVRLWDLETGQELRRLEGHADRVWDIDVSADGHFVTSASHDGTLRLWDISTLPPDSAVRADNTDLESDEGRILLDVSPQAPRSVAFSPAPPEGGTGGRFLVVGLAKGQSSEPDYSLHLLEMETGREIRRLVGHREVVADVAFSPDGRRILSGSQDLSVIVWDVDSGEEIHRLVGHTGGPLAVAFSPDGRLALSGAVDGSLLLWDVVEGVALRRYAGITKPILSVVFAPGGGSFLVAADDDAVHEYRVDATQQDLLAWIAANRYVPELTCRQREQYRIEPLCAEAEK